MNTIVSAGRLFIGLDRSDNRFGFADDDKVDFGVDDYFYLAAGSSAIDRSHSLIVPATDRYLPVGSTTRA